MKGQRHDYAEGGSPPPIYCNPLSGRLLRNHRNLSAGPGRVVGFGILRRNQRTNGTNQSMLRHGNRHRLLQPGRYLVGYIRHHYKFWPLYCSFFLAHIRFRHHQSHLDPGQLEKRDLQDQHWRSDHSAHRYQHPCGCGARFHQQCSNLHLHSDRIGVGLLQHCGDVDRDRR